MKSAVVIPRPEDPAELVMRLMFSETGKVRVFCNHESGCWEWKGAIAPNGYGRIGWNMKVYQAHRFAYTAIRGDVDLSMDLDHLCRNRCCVNPWHMEPVTRAINARRGKRGKLVQNQVDDIRKRYAAGGITQSTLAKEYRVGSDVISEIVNFKIWRPVQ